MNKYLCTLSLISGLALVGCTPNQPKEAPPAESTGGGKVKAPETLPPIDQPYKIDGGWTWTVREGGKVANLGFFEFTEDSDKQIKGISKVLVVGLKAIPGRGGNDKAAAAVVPFPLEGSHPSPEKIVFTVQGNDGTITKSEATISSDGYRLSGKSSQTDKDGKTQEYVWTAMRNVKQADMQPVK